MALYRELQPLDSYKIRLSQPFSNYDRQLLTLFYQPLIGSNAMSLFLTFWADSEQGNDQEFTHYHLMNVLTLPLGPIFEARISLEAIGLMRTFRKKEGDRRSFIYELAAPLDAKRFLSDPLLSTFLFSKIGEQAYRRLRNRFALDTEIDRDFYEVSRTFLDVYKPLAAHNVAQIEDVPIIGRNESEGIPFSYHDFDFDFLQSGLSEQMVPKSVLATVSKELIAKLAFLYSLTPLDMQKVIMMAMDENFQLPEDRLRKAAADFYKMTVSKEPPVITKVFAKQAPKDLPTEKLSRDDELAIYLENTSPIEILRDIHGKEPFSVDVKLAESLLHTYELPVGVVNVLLQYVLIRNDGKITNNYAERIASHWRNKKIDTAKKAMEISRKEHDQYLQWKNEGQKPRQQRGNARIEKVPDWFYKKEDEQIEEQTTPSNPDVEAERRKLLEELGVTKGGGK